jgi:hypothetical protein
MTRTSTRVRGKVNDLADAGDASRVMLIATKVGTTHRLISL